MLMFQSAAFLSLLGMAFAWRGVMTKYSGFYDTPTAWSHVFWGVIVGGFYASLCDRGLFHGYILMMTEQANPTVGYWSNLLILMLGISVIVHLLLRRQKVRSTSQQPTSGWALGTAIGGMMALIIIFRVIQLSDEWSIIVVAKIILIASLIPRCEALITCHQGFNMLQGKRWGAVLRSALWRTALVNVVYFSVFDITGWVFLIPILLLANRKASDWVWEAIPRPARRRLRRIWADEARRSSEEE